MPRKMTAHACVEWNLYDWYQSDWWLEPASIALSDLGEKNHAVRLEKQ